LLYRRANRLLVAGSKKVGFDDWGMTIHEKKRERRTTPRINQLPMHKIKEATWKKRRKKGTIYSV